MMTNKQIRGKSAALLAGVVLGAGAVASANAAITWNLTDTFSGTAPSGVFAVSLADAAPGVVTLTVTSGGASGEFLSSLYLNYLPNTSAAGLTIVRNSGPGSPPGVFLGLDAFKADGDGLFDIRIDFDTAPPPDRMTAGAVSVFTITGATAANFVYQSAPDPLGSQAAGYPKDGLYVAAHIQGIGLNGDSGWATVPEPTTMIAGALLLLPFAASTFRFVRRRKQA